MSPRKLTGNVEGGKFHRVPPLDKEVWATSDWWEEGESEHLPGMGLSVCLTQSGQPWIHMATHEQQKWLTGLYLHVFVHAYTLTHT